VSNDFNSDDEDDVPSSRRRRPERSAGRRWSPLRFVSPGTFGAAVILFFLPWTDLSCNGPTGKLQMVTQSAYQSAVGEASEGEGFDKLREMGGPQVGKKGEVRLDLNELRRNPMPGPGGKEKEDKTEKAPLLWLYLGLLVAGAVVPVLLPTAQIRGAIIIGFVGFALLLLVLQMILGFPLANTAADFNKEMTQREDVGRNPLGPDLKLGGKMEMKSSYLLSFWASMLMLVASGALGLIQVIVGRPTGARSRRPRRRRDDDDKPADDAGERPRRSRRDDDEEERPRRPRRDDDEEEERPRRPRRRRDDDE
jgi:hypothetical protein